MSEQEQLLAWIKRDGDAIKSAWQGSNKGLTLEQYAVMIWKKKKRFCEILSEKKP